MGTIQPNKQARVIQARKKLKTYLNQLINDWDAATSAQKLALVKLVLIALIRIQLAQLGQIEQVE